MLLKCDNISVSYDGRTVVKDVSFCLNEGEYVCIVGENGSGKTTLMKALLGLVAIDSGRITYDKIAKDEIGYLPQKLSVSSDFPASVNEIVLSGCACRKVIPFLTKDDKCRAEDALHLLGLENLRNRSFAELSGGQQQRVLLARAICAAQKLIMLDEPITSLDAKSSADFYEVLEHMNKEHGISVLMVSHDVSSAVRYAGKILHMKTSAAFFGSVDDYISTDIYKSFSGATDHGKTD